MKDLEITKELKDDIETNQNQLKKAIRNHQGFVIKLNTDVDNVDLQKQINKAEQEIITIGLVQKSLLQRLREEYDLHQKSLKNTIVKNSIEERRLNLTNALNRARKQKIVSRPNALPSSNDDVTPEDRNHFEQSSDAKIARPLLPQDLTQGEFLNSLFLVTHDVFKEMQSKRVERKRRSTANPHFLYGNRGWDYNTKKKRPYYSSVVSPPNTRQSVKKKTTERTSPPLPLVAQNGGSVVPKSAAFASFPAIPNLPSGLTIERVSPGSSSPDGKVCVTCKQPGSLAVCENCANGFHVSCHNRPLTQSPRQCPRCIVKEMRTIGALTVPSGMTVSYVTASEVEEKLEEKNELESVNKSLSAELTQLQDRHSQLTISLKNQKNQQDDLLMSQQTTEDKIKQLLTFITLMKNGNGNLTKKSDTASAVESPASPDPEDAKTES